METVERHVTLPTDAEGAWDLMTRPEDLAGWLGESVRLDPTPGATGQVVDHDGTRRHLVVDEVEAGHRLSWRWWPEYDSGAASHVAITLTPVDTGTRVTIVERVAEPAGPRAVARAGEAWSHRLLHLEVLLLVAAAVRG